MKTLAWLFGIFVCASSAYGQKTVTIEEEDGTIKTFDKSEIALIRLAFDF